MRVARLDPPRETVPAVLEITAIVRTWKAEGEPGGRDVQVVNDRPVEPVVGLGDACRRERVRADDVRAGGSEFLCRLGVQGGVTQLLVGGR